ncbi:MAG: hypothetical protein ACREH6_06355, partial [Geminicoccaceae bacterium]
MTQRNPSASGEVVGRERLAVNAHQVVWWLGLVLLVLYVAGLCAAPWYVNRGTLSLLYLVLYFILLAASWNIVSGFTGYI